MEEGEKVFRPDPGSQEQVNHPPLQNSSPETLIRFFYGVISVLETYGWLILLGIVMVWLLMEKLKPWFYKWQEERRDYQDKKNEDPNKIFRQQETMENARRKLQERIDADVARHKERQEELAMQKRREKIEDWERHRLGQGYKSKIKKPEHDEDKENNTKPKPKFKKTLRQTDYNPLTGQGGGGSACYRPTSRGGASVGG